LSGLRIDHAIYAVRDLDAAATRFAEELGLTSVPGGRHPGWGTVNRIVPLGDGYIELLAVVDADEAAGSAFGRAALAAIAAGDRLSGWVVATDDLDEVAARLGLDIASASRTRPDGETIKWRLAGVERLRESSAYPFFIQWDVPPELHPGAAPVRHEARPRRIARVEVCADGGDLRDWLGEHDLPVHVTQGVASSISAVMIDTADGEVVLR